MISKTNLSIKKLRGTKIINYRIFNRLYSYHVAACTSVGCTPYSSTSASLTVTSVPTPTLSTSNGQTSYYNGSYTLNWTSAFVPSYAGTRRYQLRTGTGVNIVSSTTSTSYSISSASVASYSYKVRACATSNADKCSSWSNLLNITVPTLSTPSLSSSDGNISRDGSYTISWNGVTGASSHQLLEDGVARCSTSVTSCPFSGKAIGSYNYQVRACAGSNCVTSSTYTVAVNLITEISTCTQLNNMRNDLGGRYKLVADINASCVTSPIGTDSTPFTGSFNGAGRTISNLTIDLPTSGRVGLFGVTGSGAKIQNVGLVGANISGSFWVGGLVGSNRGGTIINSYVTGTVTAHSSSAGGLIGSNRGGSIINSYTTTSVIGSGRSDVGGLVAWNHSGGSITNCYATGTVTNGGNVGGLVGWNDDSYPYGGEGIASSIINSYATGEVTLTFSFDDMGGLVGKNSMGTSISGTNYFVSNQDSSGGSDGVGEGSCGACTQKSLNQLTQITSTSGWTSANWSFGTAIQLPALKYANDSDTSELECGSNTGVSCGSLLPGQPITPPPTLPPPVFNISSIYSRWKRNDPVSLTVPMASNGNTPLVYSASGLPSWASFNSSSLQISGTPTSTNSSNLTITITVRDAHSRTDTYEIRYRVYATRSWVPGHCYCPNYCEDGYYTYTY